MRHDYKNAHSIEELTRQNVEAIEKLEKAAREERKMSEKIAACITKFCGSMQFVWFHIIWFGSWLFYNVVSSTPFDKFPFGLLTLVVSLEAIFLSCFILIGQNLDSAISEKRAKLDLQINLLSEQENIKMLSMLEKISDKLDIEDNDMDPPNAVLDEAADPEVLVEQLKQKGNP